MSKLATKADPWEPQHLPGGIYCAPRCGGGCTLAAFNKATKAAHALAKRMGDWEPVVWENLGWHYRIEKGIAAIYVHRDEYDCYVNFPGKQFLGQAKTPEDALGFAVQDARTFQQRIASELSALLEPSP